MRTLIIIVYLILMPLGAVIALVSAFTPPPKPNTYVFSKPADLGKTQWTARDEAEWCAKQLYGCGPSGTPRNPLADRVDELESRITTLENDQ